MIIIINYFYNAHKTLQGMSLCAVRKKKRLGRGTCTVPIVPKKITIGIWVLIAKEPFMESEKSNRIMDYETMTIFLQFSEDPI